MDTVLFSDAQIKAATNRNQWYVSISRARKKIRIYTSDKEALRENICRLGERPLAMDLAGIKDGVRTKTRKKCSPSVGLRKRALLAVKSLMIASRRLRIPVRRMLLLRGVARTASILRNGH